MKILHCMLSSFYVDGYNYQENILPKINKKDGHEVLIVASTETFIDNNKHGFTKAGEYYNNDNIKVIRLPYMKIAPRKIMAKVRKYKGLYRVINDFSPDVILFHGMAATDIRVIVKYIKNNPNVKLFIDSHEDENNSAQNIISRIFLHKLLNRSTIQKSIKYVDKYLPITYESKLFIEKYYKVPPSKIELFPLGGKIITDDEKNDYRKSFIEKYQINPNNLIFTHTGKMDSNKKTEDIIRAFSSIEYKEMNLIIAGTFDDSIKKEVEYLISKDSRIKYLGWKNQNELQEILAATDLYIQPGGQSVTMQNSICLGTSVAIYPHISHKYLLEDLPFYIENEDDIRDLMEKIIKDRNYLIRNRKEIFYFAKINLDYNNIVKVLY